MISDAAFVPPEPRGTVLGDEVYRVIGEAILDGRLAPGERLRDVELAGRLGVSRTPVREALQRLERIGMVQVSANRWTRVSRPDAKILSDTRKFVAYTMDDAIRLAVSRCSDEGLGALPVEADAMGRHPPPTTPSRSSTPAPASSSWPPTHRQRAAHHSHAGSGEGPASQPRGVASGDRVAADAHRRVRGVPRRRRPPRRGRRRDDDAARPARRGRRRGAWVP